MSQLNTLVILAGGNGSRFGGAKQFACFGHKNRTLMEYNLYHAIEAGFNHVIFVTQAQQKLQLEREVITRLPENLTVNIVIQSLDILPDICHISPTRTKPLGTAHALWCAKDVIQGNFAVINADDYYGQQAFKLLTQQQARIDLEANNACYAMVAYLVKNTLSEHGGVNRGLCEYSSQMQLLQISEVENIRQVESAKNTEITGVVSTTKQTISLAPDSLVSMNCWAFNQKIFPAIEQMLINTFTLDASEKDECYLPSVVMQQLEKQQVNVDVLSSSDDWFGVTYAADSALVDHKINTLISILNFSL